MRVLGLANGTPGGNSEILLKAASSGVSKADPSATLSWIHVPSVSIPPNAPPLEGARDISLGSNEVMTRRGEEPIPRIPDDRATVLNAILDADAPLFSTPIYSHQPAGTLKHVIDKIIGPWTDVAFAQRTLKKQEECDPAFQGQIVDKRLLKPRALGFIAVGGSTTPDQFTMALPTLHLLVYSIQAKVVDQFICPGAGSPGAVVTKDGGAWVERAIKLGSNVASQMGKTFRDAKFLGEEPFGACPYCHLAKFEFLDATDKFIGCVTCGALGQLVQGKDGVLRPLWAKDCDVSSITMAGKMRHVDDLMANGQKEMAAIKSDSSFDEKKRYWIERDYKMVKLPSKL
jgi:multimeric flavodoxin WrbA